jgi:hypothetical protein
MLGEWLGWLVGADVGLAKQNVFFFTFLKLQICTPFASLFAKQASRSFESSEQMSYTLRVGKDVGSADGLADGKLVGLAVVGDADGEADGFVLGESVGSTLGLLDGEPLGSKLGLSDGEEEGKLVGESEGDALGSAVGDPVVGADVVGANVSKTAQKSLPSFSICKTTETVSAKSPSASSQRHTMHRKSCIPVSISITSYNAFVAIASSWL